MLLLIIFLLNVVDSGMKLLYLFILLPFGLQAQTNFSDTANLIDKIIQPWNYPNFPGVSLAVSRNGQLIYAKAVGSADLEHGVPNDTATIFEAGSVSKQFTAAAILLLELDGKLSRQDDVRKYIPELPSYGSVITIYDLIHHQSGLRDWGSVADLEGWSRSTRAHTNAHALQIICRQTALNNPPGTEYIYSNSNYNLMAIIVERVAKTTFAKFCKDRIFVPAGMTHTSWRNDYRQIVKKRAIAYQQTPMILKTQMPFEDAHGNGGLLTTASDLVKWTNFMHTAQLGGPVMLQWQLETGRFRNGLQHSYAAGLRITQFNGQDLVTHSGATAGYRANLDYFPQQGLSIALLSNTSSFSPVQIAEKIAAIFLPPTPAQSGTPVTPLVYTAPPAEISALAGWYRNIRTDESIFLEARDSTLVLPNKKPLYKRGDGTAYTEGARILFLSGGKNRAFLRVSFDNPADTVEFVRETAPKLESAYFEQFKGTYFSEEANSRMQVNFRDTILLTTLEPDEPVAFKPTYKDGFAVPGTAIRFARNKKGKVTGFHVSVGRARKIWFRKE